MCRSVSSCVGHIVGASVSQLVGRSVDYESVGQLVDRSFNLWVGQLVYGSVSQLMGRTDSLWAGQTVAGPIR